MYAILPSRTFWAASFTLWDEKGTKVFDASYDAWG